MNTIREELQQYGAPTFESLIQNLGEPAAYRSRIREMARNGDLALIAKVIDVFSREHLKAILSETPTELCALERGGLIGLRNFWWHLLNMGEQPMQDAPPVFERNEFAEILDLTSLDGA